MRNTSMQHKSIRGFTLIELMIVVAIIGIITSIALPSYREFINRSRRAEAQSILMASSQWMERFYSENYRYDQNAAGTGTNDATQFPARFSTSPEPGHGAAQYTINLVVARNQYTITATRVGAMVNDRCGDFTIDQLGRKSIAAGTWGAQYATLGDAIRDCWK